MRYNSQWTGPLLGDKSWSTLFDTSKVQSLSGPVQNPIGIDEGFTAVHRYFDARLPAFKPDSALHDLLDRIVLEQESLGSKSGQL